MKNTLHPRIQRHLAEQEVLLSQPNRPLASQWDTGIYQRYEHCVLTADHVPVAWRFDMDPQSNPLGLERMGIDAVCNAGAIFHEGRYVLVARIEGYDRKSFFGIAESDSPVNGFRFRAEPLDLPDWGEPVTNNYDMRLTKHEDGYIYGIWCVERKDPSAPPGDQSAAVAQCGVARTKDLHAWERLPDIKTPSAQQRNVVLHPEFVDGKYALYTRPQDSFIEAGKGGGIGWAFADSMDPCVVASETAFEPRIYHTIKEAKNGQGPAPIKTKDGWLHLAHGVRYCAAGLRYVLYMFMTSLDEPSRVIHSPGGYFMAPEGGERVGDVSNVLFVNGWIEAPDGHVYIYYASSDTRLHVAKSDVARLVDYCKNTPPDGLRSEACVKQRLKLIEKNRAVHA